jgi:phosphohistidine phosphatase SixA
MTHPVDPSRRAFLGLVPAGLMAGGLLAQEAPSPEAPPLGAPSGAPLGAPSRSATVVFVRHCEKEGGETDDPGLTDRGRVRARRLAGLLSGCTPTQLFATELRRTQQSLVPLAEATGLSVEPYGARDPEALIQALQEGPGGDLVVVAGHSNTLPHMVGLLGGELAGLDPRGHLPESEYDRVVIQVLSAPSPDEPLKALSTLDLRLELDG